MTPALAEATRAGSGAIVADIQDDGPSAGALEPGDVITAIDDVTIDTPDRLLLEIARRRPGTAVRLAVARGGEVRPVELTVAPAAALAPPSGAEFADMRVVHGAGAMLTGVPPGGRASAAGLAEGDVIVGIGPMRAPTPAQVRRVLADAAPGSHVLLTVVRNDRQRVVAVAAAADDATR